LFALLWHLAKLYPDTEFTYFVADTNVERDDLIASFSRCPNVRVVPIRAAIPAGADQPAPQVDRGWVWNTSVAVLRRSPRVHRALRDAYVSAKRALLSEPLPWYCYKLDDEVVGQVDEHDVVYIGWPYFVKPVKFSIPLVATFHDFHFRHFPEAYPADQLRTADSQTRSWLKLTNIAIVSTEFMRDEMRRYFGDVMPRTDVVYLASYGFNVPAQACIDETLARLGVTRPYVLYSGSTSEHKNVGTLLRAASRLKDLGTPVQLVITGMGTERVGGGQPASGGDSSIEHALRDCSLERGADYLPLGYVSNADVDALTAGADAVVSASLYEAGCGPAMDAWQAGVPVAFSNIPPFVEQLQRFGVEAWVFDPRDPADVAAKIGSAVFDRETSQHMVERSKRAFASYDWDDVARGYMDVFRECVGELE
jgi:glycosyltransferase involved in cell wall biosynthesis